jgi:S1-C subfamily serine protease
MEASSITRCGRWLCCLAAVAIAAGPALARGRTAAERLRESRKRRLEAERRRREARPVRPPVPPRPVPPRPWPGRTVSSTAAQQAFEQLHRFLVKVKQGAVTVVAQRAKRADSSATGFFVTAGGLVATSRHALAHDDLAGIQIQRFGEEPVAAVAVAMDANTDLAILRPSKPLRPAALLVGREAAAVKAGEPVISLGCPAQPRLALSAGKVNGVYSADALREVLAEKFTGRHAYKYVETNAAMGHGTTGGLLLDADAGLLGMCALKVPDAPMGFVLEWRAAAELAKKAASAKPIPLEAIRAGASKDALSRLFGKPTTSHTVRAAVLKHRWAMYCPKCGGRGYVMVTRHKPKQVRKPYRTVSGRRFVTRYRTVTVMVPVKVRVTCPTCRKRLINPTIGDAYSGLCEIVKPLMAMDHNCYRALAAWQEAGDALEHASLDDLRYGMELSAAAAGALAEPKAGLGKPVVFLGTVEDAHRDGAALLYLVRVAQSGRNVIVVCRGKVTVLKGMPCFVAGNIWGAGGETPHVLAAAVNMLHKADAAYKPARPKVKPPKPKPVARPSAGTAQGRLNTAKMFLSGGLKAKAASVLRDLIKNHPKSDAAKEAELLLIDLEGKPPARKGGP